MNKNINNIMFVEFHLLKHIKNLLDQESKKNEGFTENYQVTMSKSSSRITLIFILLLLVICIVLWIWAIIKFSMNIHRLSTPIIILCIILLIFFGPIGSILVIILCSNSNGMQQNMRRNYVQNVNRKL